MQPPNQQELRRAAGIFKALAHPARVRVAWLLADGRVTTQRALLDELHWPQSTMARHVATLRERGVVTATRRGNEVFLQLTDDLVPELLAKACAWARPDGVGAAPPDPDG